VAKVIVATGRSVAAHDLFTANLGAYGYMLADGKAKDVLRMWQRKAISGRKWHDQKNLW
jgi:hypothetical protein